MDRRVVITGMGWVTPLGHSLEEVWRRLLAGESGVASTTIFEAGTFPTSFSAEVRDFDLQAILAEGQRDWAEPGWPQTIAAPIPVDKHLNDTATIDDDHIYWGN